MKRPILPCVPAFCVVALFCASLSSCMFVPDTDSGDDSTSSGTASYGALSIEASSAPVTAVPFGTSESTRSVTINGLSGQTVYFVKVNTGSTSVTYANTGYAQSSTMNRTTTEYAPVEGTLPESSLSNLVSPGGTGVTPVEALGVQEYNDNPLVTTKASAGSSARLSSSVLDPVSSTLTTGTTRAFYVTAKSSSPYAASDWSTLTATLEYEGTYCHVWVPAANISTDTSNSDNCITVAQAAALGAKFDAIYPVETSLLGHEYGADSTDSGYVAGGWDGDEKINILVYDIFGDYSTTSSSHSGTLGYFWSKDEYTAGAFTSGSSTYYSNASELFYIDLDFTDYVPNMIYSTLVHEFQHMIHFNEKYLVSGNSSSPQWYNEMLSMAAEETVGTKIGLDSSGLPWAMRMKLFTALYGSYGINEWDSYGYSYPVAYAFGSYLLHNYGGAALLSAMEKNTSTGTASITAAVNAVNGTSCSFTDILGRYGEALVFGASGLPSSVCSFYKAVSSTVSSVAYTTPLYDISSVANYYAYTGYTPSTEGVTYDSTGVSLYGNNYQYILPSYGIQVFSGSAWKNLTTSSLTITLAKPADTDVLFYIMVR